MKRHVTAETRAKLSAAAKRRWAAGNGTEEEVRNVVKYVPDDDLTAIVELLRQMMPAEEVTEKLRVFAHSMVSQGGVPQFLAQLGHTAIDAAKGP